MNQIELWCWRRLLRVPWTARRSNQSKSVLNIHWKDWCWSWNSSTLATWWEELTHLKRPWCWERLKAGGEGDDRGWDGWMASPTQWTWVNSRSWWWTERPWCAAVHRVAKSRTWLSDWTELNEPNYYDGVVSHWEPDILECEVKWTLRSTALNKASGSEAIPVEQFKSLKDDTNKVLYSLCHQIWKTQQWPQDWKSSVLIPVPKKDSTKECANHQTVALISHASKFMLKILHSRLQHYVNQELPDVQAGLRNRRGSRDQITSIHWIIEKQGHFRKISISFIISAKAFDCVDQDKRWTNLREMGIPDHLIYFLRNLYGGKEATVRTQYGTTDWFKIRERSTIQLSVVTMFVYLYAEHIIRNARLDVKSRNQDRWEKHQQPQKCGWYHSNGRKQTGTKEPLHEGEGGQFKGQLKTKY